MQTVADSQNRLDPPVLVAGDLLLRELVGADASEVTLTCQDGETQRWLPLPNPYTEAVALEFITRIGPAQQASGDGVIRAVERDGRLVGCVDLKHTDWAARATETGYWVAPWARRKGVGSMATRALADWALTAGGLERVELLAATGNVGSQRVAERAGFVREGVARNAGYVHGGRVDLVVYSKIPSDIARLDG